MATEITKTIVELRQKVRAARERGLSVGLVLTMGALHAGHTSLIRAARQESGCVVVSLFVNPTQFGPTEDLASYPRSWEADVAVCESEGADLLFAPPDGGATRPGI